MRLLLFLTLSSILLAEKQPNVLFILADDLGVKDLSGEGSEFYETPHIDSIAESGTRFTRGYSTCQVCSPSRASILTGTYPVTHGVTEYIGASFGKRWKRHTAVLPASYKQNLPHEHVTIAEALEEAGYATGFFGKWHLGSKGSWPEDHGFQVNVGGWDKGGPYGGAKDENGKRRKGGGFFAPFANPNIPVEPKDGKPLPHFLAEQAADFIQKSKESEKPFLAYLSFYAVHAPVQCSQELWEKYQRKAEKMGLTGEGKERFLFDRRLNVRQIQDFPTYAGLLELMDDGVGIVLEQLKELGLEEDTIVIFTSDNGGVSTGDAYATSCLPYRGGKGRQWEGGIRQPYYIKAPRLDQVESSDQLVSGIDFYSTILDLCEVGLPKDCQEEGMSLYEVMKSGKKDAERCLYWHYPHYGNQGGDPSSIIMQGDWKLIFYHEDKHLELYNLAEDIGERNELGEKYPEKRDELNEKLQAWLKENGALFPSPNPNFSPEKFQQEMKREASKGKAGKERVHAQYLLSGYQPNNNWWGSTMD